MKRFLYPFTVFFAFSVFLQASFAKTNKINAEAEIRQLIESKTNLRSQEQAALKDLSLNQALALALHRNLEMKTALSELQIAVQERKQLGLVESPELEFATRFPVASPDSQVAYDLQFTQNLMDLVKLSTRKKIGLANYESRKWETASQILKILTQVKIAYIEYQAALQLQNFWQKNQSAASAAVQLAQAQRQAGNISELDQNQNQALAKMAELEWKQSQSAAEEARIHLAQWIHLGVRETWRVSEKLKSIPWQDPKIENLKKLSEENRPDLMAQKQAIHSKQSQVSLAKKSVLPRVDVGVNAEWDAEGSRGVGPSIALGMPFLGHRKNEIARARAELKATENKLAATQQGIPYDLEATYEKLKRARSTVEYQDQIAKLQSNILEESLKHYNYMLLGNYQLLQAKQNQIEAQRKKIEALRDYWIARAELEFLTGVFWEK